MFPQGSIPTYPVQLAALAVRVYRLFLERAAKVRKGASAISDAEIAHAILAVLSEP
jgi:hypothetical protein